MTERDRTRERLARLLGTDPDEETTCPCGAPPDKCNGCLPEELPQDEPGGSLRIAVMLDDGNTYIYRLDGGVEVIEGDQER